MLNGKLETRWQCEMAQTRPGLLIYRQIQMCEYCDSLAAVSFTREAVASKRVLYLLRQ
jgi:hypothetical protein